MQMGIIDWFSKKKVITKGYFKLLDGYTPVYTSYSGGLYEMAQTRAVINTIATDCSKSIPELKKHNKEIEYMLQVRPNQFMSTSNFIERVVTCYLVDNNAFILPILDVFGRTIGLFPVAYSQVELLDVGGVPYVRYRFNNGETACIEYSKVGHLKRMLYKNDVFGTNNSAIHQTMELIHSQNESVQNALKSSGSVRFKAQLTQQMDEEDLKIERNAFSEINFSNENKQMMIFDSRYKDITQIESKAIFLDDKQQQMINQNIENYFGVSSKVIRHEFSSDYEWNSYYEGVIEPILIKLGEEITKMLYSSARIIAGNMVYFTANRLQYMSNESKLAFSTQMFDRGIIDGNTVSDVWNLPHYEGGEKRYIRKEYAEISKLEEESQKDKVQQVELVTGKDGGDDGTDGKTEE